MNLRMNINISRSKLNKRPRPRATQRRLTDRCYSIHASSRPCKPDIPHLASAKLCTYISCVLEHVAIKTSVIQQAMTRTAGRTPRLMMGIAHFYKCEAKSTSSFPEKSPQHIHIFVTPPHVLVSLCATVNPMLLQVTVVSRIHVKRACFCIHAQNTSVSQQPTRHGTQDLVLRNNARFFLHLLHKSRLFSAPAPVFNALPPLE